MSVLDRPKDAAQNQARSEPASIPGDSERRDSEAWRHWVVALVLCVLAAAYLSFYFNRAWIPSDEGLLAHSAERVLQGELPHRDFDEMYTGGLTYLHAAAFRLLGVRLTSIRVVLFVFSLAFVAATYSVAARQRPWWLAALTTAACFVWSVPNYFTGMPSWYNLFLTVFGIVALFRFVDTSARRWLFVAGLFGGLALLVKITGLYYIAAVLMFLLYRNQVYAGGQVSMGQSGGTTNNADRSGARSVLFVAFTVVMSALLLLMLAGLLRHNLRINEVVFYLIPCGILCAILIGNELRVARGPTMPRIRRLSADVLLFTVGVVVPVIGFLSWYAGQGALGDLYRGTIVLPRQRFAFASLGLQPLNTLLPAVLPSVVVLASALGWPRFGRFGKIVVGGFLLFVAGLLLVFADQWYYWGLFGLRGLVPAVTAATAIVLLRSRSVEIHPSTRQTMFLVAAAAVLGSFVQYPFAILIYFCFCAPLLLLALGGLTIMPSGRPRAGFVGLIAFFLTFGMIHLNASFLTDSRNPIRRHAYALGMERAGLRVLEQEQQTYDRVIALVRQHSRPGSSIYAAPDCMEVYFLADRQNPMRTMYDFFDTAPGRADRILTTLDRRRVEVVVINTTPLFSERVSGELAAGIQSRFPNRETVGNLIVAWRDLQ